MDLVHGFQLLGVNPSDLSKLRSHPKAIEALAQLQQTAKAHYKKLVLELHPDRNGDDPVKAYHFNLVTQANKWLQELRLEPAPVQARKTITIFVPLNRPWAQSSVHVRSSNTVPDTGSSPSTRKYDARKVASLTVD